MNESHYGWNSTGTDATNQYTPSTCAIHHMLKYPPNAIHDAGQTYPIKTKICRQSNGGDLHTFDRVDKDKTLLCYRIKMKFNSWP